MTIEGMRRVARTVRAALMGGALAAWGCLCTPAGAQEIPAEWNVRPQVLGLFDKLESGQVGSLAIVGDSISFHHDSYNWFLRDRFWADYGNAGDGYLAACTGFGSSGDRNGPRDPIMMTISPTEVTLASANSDREAWGWYEPEGLFSRLWGAGYVQLKLFGPQCRLHYLKQPGGGTLRVAINKKVLVDAPTNGAIEDAWVDLSVGGDMNTLKTLKLSSLDGGTVQVSGIDMRTGAPGLVYHRLARGAAGPRDFVRSNTPATASLLADLSPDLLIVMLDWVGWDEKATFVEDTNRLLDFYAQAMPTTRVILMTHHPFKADIVDEAAWYYQIARERGMGFINLFATWPGGQAEMMAAGLLEPGGVHLTGAGGQWFGNYVYDLLKRDGTCLGPAIEGQSSDQVVDEGSGVEFFVTSPNALTYQWRKDGQEIPGADGPTLTIQAVMPGDAGSYDCLLTNGCDSAASQPGLLTVTPGSDKTWWYRDGDGDGFGADADRVFEADGPDGYVAVPGDCDDADPAIHPGAEEVLNGRDDNCDGQTDEGLGQWWYLDLDGDAFGEDEQAVFQVERPDQYAAAGGDCDDLDPGRFPGATELHNGLDDDCDGVVDNGFEQWWFRDADGDGFGEDLDLVFALEPPEGYVASPDDCDDADPGVYPGAPELLNGIDDNCDGHVDEGFATLWYRDADGDGYGDPDDTLLQIPQPEGYIARGGDCDDANGAVNPGALEVFDGVDNDCDGQTDEDISFFYYRDADGDGFGDPSDMLLAGAPPEGYVTDASDCDDADPAVNPLAPEVCDGVDNNCDGNTDEGAGPVITRDPSGLTAYVGDPAVFSVQALGGGSYQWRKNGVNIPGATGTEYTIQKVLQSHAGVYSVVVSDPCGQAASAGATLQVLIPVAPAAPSALGGAEPVKGTASLTWTDNATGESKFQVWREKQVAGQWVQGQVVATLAADSVVYAEQPGPGNWRYRVRAGQGNKYSPWTTYRLVRPHRPSGLKAARVNGAAALTWSDDSDFEATFTIQRQKYVNAAWAAIETLPPQGTDTTQMTDSPGPGKYRYRVRANNAAGSSAWTAWMAVSL
jgi:hypothetical protein